LRASLLLESKISKTSKLRQVISLTAVSSRIDFETTVDWDENRQFLVSFFFSMEKKLSHTNVSTTWLI